MKKIKPHHLFRHHPTPPYPSPSPSPSPPYSSATKSFNSKLNKLSTQNQHTQVLTTFAEMLKTDTQTDAFTFPSLLKAATSLLILPLGLCIHLHVIVSSLSRDPYIASSLIHFYARFGLVGDARKVFDGMSERNVVPWTAIVGCYSKSRDHKNAFFMFNRMRYEGVEMGSVTILTLLTGVEDVRMVRYGHACIEKYGFGSDLVLMNSLLNLYGGCGSVEDAGTFFESMEKRDVVSWNTVISSYARIGKMGFLDLFRRMKNEGVDPDRHTYGSLLSVIAKRDDVRMGKLVHARIITTGYEFELFLVTSLISMYLRYGLSDDAFVMFERITEKDVVLWTTMISGLVQNGRADKALEVFRLMLVNNVFPSPNTIACVLSACSQLGCFDLGTSVHAFIIRKRIILDNPAKNSLISMYAKCNRLEQSRVIFDNMDDKDVVSWNAIVSGYAQNGDLGMSLYYFNEMRKTLQKPDNITVVSLLQACACLGALQQGKWVHTFVARSCLGPCLMIDTALVDMYSKCGELKLARKCFDAMPEHDLVSWTTIIAAYGSHGKGAIALEMYNTLLSTGLKPNATVLVSILSACSHNGLVDEGLEIFNSMKNDFRVEPEMEHLACVVDLYSRAGRVRDAYQFYKKMFLKPSVDVLGMVLDACRSSGDLELAKIISESIFILKPTDGGKYWQVARSYASMDRWDDVSETLVQMKSLGIKKLPGWSFIELNGIITMFYTYHGSHPQNEDIVRVLKFLGKEIRNLGVNLRSEKTIDL